MPETVIRPAVDAQRLAAPLIRQHHEHLRTARILWLTTSAKRKKADKSVLATSSRMSVIQRYLSSAERQDASEGYDFLILISAAQWRSLNQAQQLALVDHQLARCGQKQTVNRRTGAVTQTWCTLSPDVEEFRAVIERHGLWLPAHKEFAAVIPRQLELEPAPSPNGAAVESEDGWKTQTGVGASEHEQRRRGRRKTA
jgi:hypothetical protein